MILINRTFKWNGVYCYEPPKVGVVTHKADRQCRAVKRTKFVALYLKLKIGTGILDISKNVEQIQNKIYTSKNIFEQRLIHKIPCGSSILLQKLMFSSWGKPLGHNVILLNCIGM